MDDAESEEAYREFLAEDYAATREQRTLRTMEMLDSESEARLADFRGGFLSATAYWEAGRAYVHGLFLGCIRPPRSEAACSADISGDAAKRAPRKRRRTTLATLVST